VSRLDSIAHLIGQLPEAYQCAVADVNGDGKPDIIRLSSGQPGRKIAWYENPSWKKHLVTTATRRISIAAFGLDSDSKLEIAVASEDFDLNNARGGRLNGSKAAGPDAGSGIGHEIANLPTAHQHSLGRLLGRRWQGLVVDRRRSEKLPRLVHKGGVPITSRIYRQDLARSRLVDRAQLPPACGAVIPRL